MIDVLRWLSILLTVCLLLTLPVYAAYDPVDAGYQKVTLLSDAKDLQVEAFQSYFFCFDRAHPDQIRVLHASDGSLAAFYMLDEASGAADSLRMKALPDCMLLLTPRYAYRIDAALRVTDRVSIPSLESDYDISADLSSIVYASRIDIVWMDLASGETRLLLEGSYVGNPQQFFSAPTYVCNDQKLLVYCSNEKAYVSPAVYDFESGQLFELPLLYDSRTQEKLNLDTLLVTEAWYQYGVMGDTEEKIEALRNADLSASLFSGVLDLQTLRITPLPTDWIGHFGSQPLQPVGSNVYGFDETEAGWQLFRSDAGAPTMQPLPVQVSASGIELMAATEQGKVLFRYFDLQNAMRNGYALATNIQE